MKVLRATWDHFGAIRGGTLAAAISYRALFALAPLLVGTVAVAGAILAKRRQTGSWRSSSAPWDPKRRPSRNSCQRQRRPVGRIGVLIFIWPGSGLFVESRVLCA